MTDTCICIFNTVNPFIIDSDQVMNATDDLRRAATMPQIRFMKLNLKTSSNVVEEPQIEVRWQKPGNGMHVSQFEAICKKCIATTKETTIVSVMNLKWHRENDLREPLILTKQSSEPFKIFKYRYSVLCFF